MTPRLGSRYSIGRVFRIKVERTHGAIKPPVLLRSYAVYNYDHQALYPRGEKNGRLKNQMTASGDVMTMRCPPLPGTGSARYAENRPAGVIRRRLPRVTNK
ncbi:unnamed protein product [Lasius platythorax]|uniref:Uncharacterized protein n=1 Tax=Lasius platythorax TaxID=488582 RepID=A0AAV2NFC7_9HYME